MSTRYYIIGFLLLLRCLSYSQPPCNEEIAEPTYTCPEAPIVCDLNYFCSTMPVSISPVGAVICGMAISLDNPHWFSFIATSSTVTVTINPTNCLEGGGGSLGLQGAIVSTCPAPPGGGNFQTVGECQSIPCATGEFTIGTWGNFTVGQQYWIMLDGCSGSICDYQITHTEGIMVPWLEEPTLITGPAQVCPGGTASFLVDDPDFATTFYWTVDGVPVISMGPEMVYTFPSGMPEGIYEVCLENAANACYDLVGTNGYEPNSLCTEIEVLNIPETNFGPIIVCAENAPFSWDGFEFYPPAPVQQYILEASTGCDSIINLSIEWIQHVAEDELMVTCEGDFPVVHPIYGSVFESGTFFVDYTDPQYGCDSSFNLTVSEMVFQFDVNIPRYDLQCPGETITIDAAQSAVLLLPDNLPVFNTEYEWFRNGVSIGMGVFLTISQGGSYVFRMTATEGGITCFQEFVFTIQEFFEEPEVPAISGPMSGCVGSVASYNITNWDGISEIAFMHSNCYEVIEVNGPSFTVRFTEACSGQFCVVFTKPNCPELSSQSCFSFTIAAQLDPGVTGDLTFCEGFGTSLEAAPGFTEYTWTGPNGFGSGMRVISINSPGIYYVEVTDSNGCSGGQTLTVVENPSPPVSFSGSTAFCPGGRSIITANPGNYTDYNWSNGEEGPQVIFTVAGQYT